MIYFYFFFELFFNLNINNLTFYLSSSFNIIDIALKLLLNEINLVKFKFLLIYNKVIDSL